MRITVNIARISPAFVGGTRGNTKYYNRQQQDLLLSVADQAYTLLYGKAKDGCCMESLGRMQMRGLDGELAFYIPQTLVKGQLGIGNDATVAWAAQQWWVRVGIERAQGGDVHYAPRPGELPCVRFNNTHHGSVWCREDAIPGFARHLRDHLRGRPVEWQK